MPGLTIAETAETLLVGLVRETERTLSKVHKKGGVGKIHRLRSEARRACVMLDAVGVGFDGAEVERLRKSLRRVRKLAGHVRDIDVGMKLVGRLCAAEPRVADEARDAIKELMKERRERRLEELVEERKGVCRAVSKRLERVLGSPVRARAQLPVGVAAKSALVRVEETMRGSVHAVLTTPEQLHALRLNLKEARTLMELLGGALPKGAAAVAERARQLSDRLGKTNDMVVLAELLEKVRKREKDRAVRRAIDVVISRARARCSGDAAEAARKAGKGAGAVASGIRGVILAGSRG